MSVRIFPLKKNKLLTWKQILFSKRRYHRRSLTDWSCGRIGEYRSDGKNNIGSNKICIRSDLAKKNMMFSQESCQAIFEMGNVQLIELKKSRVQCPSCLHYVFEGTIICSCEKLIKSNQEMTQRIRKAFEVLKMSVFRASHPNSRGYKHGSQLWQQHHHKANDALRAATRKKDRSFVNIWSRWENDLDYRKSQEAIGWNDVLVRYLEQIVQIDISHEALAEQRGRYNNLVHPRGFEESLQGMPLIKWPGYQEAKLATTEVWWQSRREMSIAHIPTKDRKRLNDELDPEIGKAMRKLGAALHKRTRTPNLIILFSVVWSSTWKGKQQHSLQDDTWSDQR